MSDTKPKLPHKHRGVFFSYAKQPAFKQWSAILNPDNDEKRIDLHVYVKRGKRKPSEPRRPFVFHVVGKGLRETGEAEYLGAALEAATRLAFSHCPEQPTQYHPGHRTFRPVKMPA